MNRKKLLSAIVALAIYCGIIFLVLFYYNIHKIEAKKFVEKDDNRVTVTLVNSDKTVFNKKSEKSNRVKPHSVTPPIPLKKDTPKKVVPKKHVVKKHRPKKVVPKKQVVKKHVVKKHRPKKVVPKKVIPKKHVVKKHIPKKVVPKKVVPKKPVVKKHIPKKVVPKKVVPKKVVPKKQVVKKHRPKKVVPKKVLPVETVEEYRPKIVVPKKVVPKKSPRDLFSNVKSHRVKKAPVIKRPAPPPPRIHTIKRPKPVFSQPYQQPQRQSRVKHSSSVTDRIKNSHLSGRISNTNRNSGVKNAYIARVRRHMNNWTASSAYQGQRVTIILTIYQNGTFNYTVSGGGADMQNSLRSYLDRLNRIGLGRHNKSSPYHIKVPFTVR